MLPLTHDECIIHLEQVRWDGYPQCPYCGSRQFVKYKKKQRYHCSSCFTSYSVTVGTLFHKTHVGLHKWLQVISLVMKSPSSINVCHLARELEVNRNTASYMLSRIHKAMQEEPELLQNLMKTCKNTR
jgi:transposase-like protein